MCFGCEHTNLSLYTMGFVQMPMERLLPSAMMRKRIQQRYVLLLTVVIWDWRESIVNAVLGQPGSKN